MTMSLGDYYSRLTRDEWRVTHPYPADFVTANLVLHDTFVRDLERRIAIDGWFQEHQPCMFGKLAAKRDGIHYCFLSTEDLLRGDDHVKDKVKSSKRLWKHRAIRGVPKHGFVLLACDRKLTEAAPDENLRQFALHLQKLAFGEGLPDPEGKGNSIVTESLYLKHPVTQEVVRFEFSVDFFASAGDARWWHDHRVPGGMAFTANSLGHMIRYQEWYENRTDRLEWGLKTAMLTIDAAAEDVPHGPATKLLTKIKNRPIRPFNWTAATAGADIEKFKGKDCGSYGGYHHTDHCVRPEFFLPQESPLYKDEQWLMDFAYIFDPAEADHLPFMIGHIVTDAEVEADIGPAGAMRTMGLLGSDDAARSEENRGITGLEKALDDCKKWRLSDDEEAALL